MVRPKYSRGRQPARRAANASTADRDQHPGDQRDVVAHETARVVCEQPGDNPVRYEQRGGNREPHRERGPGQGSPKTPRLRSDLHGLTHGRSPQFVTDWFEFLFRSLS